MSIISAISWFESKHGLIVAIKLYDHHQEYKNLVNLSLESVCERIGNLNEYIVLTISGNFLSWGLPDELKLRLVMLIFLEKKLLPVISEIVLIRFDVFV